MQVLKKGSRGSEVKRLQQILHIQADGIFGAMTEEAVKTFQKEHGLVVDGIVGYKTWFILSQFGDVLNKSKRTIKEIIVHCSATPEGKDFTVADITKWHLARGFTTIGYHYVVYRDGSVHEGRNVDVAGAHCTNHNMYSIGVCYIGGCAADGKTPKDTRTPAQKEALVKLLKQLKQLYPTATIHGHCEYAAKACPCFSPKDEYKNI